jgi:phage shock protein PspC (stress-responsive transcriptional regulator)
MKKIININFHGRVVPIEETAYDILKQYVDSLRRHFANEEGRDEIINDIENRFAELFSERLQKGSTCITDDDVNAIITSMGRPEDFEREDMAQNGGSSNTSSGNTQQNYSKQSSSDYSGEYSRQLYRSENDKLLGGVCAGLANYLRVDPAIVRIIFALVTLGAGLGILIYIILWIALPTKSLANNTRKRLYRNPENRIIGGVASGLAAYFHIDVWIPRLIFALPLVFSILTSLLRRSWFEFDDGPAFISSGFGGTLFVTYIILWIVLPEATSASEKLEMRGEKVDLESIKNTIKNDLEGFKGRAAVAGAEMKEKAQQFGQDFKQATQSFSGEAGPVIRRTGSGLGHVIGVLFKAFFLFIAGVIAFALITALIGLFFTGAGVLPFRHYFLFGFWQNFFGWSTLIFFIAVPIIGLLTWLIRRIIGVRSRKNSLGYVFGSLWTLGWIALIIFISMIVNNFRNRTSVEDELNIGQPVSGKMIIKTNDARINYYGGDWFGNNWNDDGPFYNLSEDSVMLTTVRVNLTKSPDSAYHIRRVRFSHGNTPALAKSLASQIAFDIQQKDSLVMLPQGFAITPSQKFRNQQVLLIVEIPVGKRIMMDRSIDDYHWFNININRRHSHWNNEGDDYWNDYNPVSNNVEYIMTETGLERTNKVRSSSSDEEQTEKPREGYRYKGNGDSSTPTPKRKKDPSPGKGESEKAAPSSKKVEPAKSALLKTMDNPEYSFTPIISNLFM